MATTHNASYQAAFAQCNETNRPVGSWTETALSSRQDDQRREPWKEMFKNEKMNCKTGRDPDIGTYDECAAQENGGGD
jgi:hypothetical protein